VKKWSINYREVGAYLLVFITGLFLLQLITSANLEMTRLGQRLQGEEIVIPFLIRALGGLMFGALIKWRSLYRIIKGNLQLNLKLIPGVLLALISFIPQHYFFYIYRINVPLLLNPSVQLSHGLNSILRSLFIAPLQHGSISLVLSVAAGVLIVEGLYKAEVE